MHSMDWNDVRYFLAVARRGTLQGAAGELGVNHSTVFRRINRFEEAIGARLFERGADGYRLTDAGERLAGHAERVGDAVGLLELSVAGEDYRPSGTIRLTAPDNLAYEYLPAYLADFNEQYPDISLELVVGAESLNLTRREADVAVRATPAPPEHLVGRKVCSLRWSFYASEGYLERHGEPPSQAALGDHRLIGADGALERLPPFRAQRDAFGDAIVMTCSTLNAMSAMARAGYAIALLPDDQVDEDLQSLFPLKPNFTSDIWLLTHPELRRVERIRLLMDHLFTAFREDERIRRIALR